MTWFKVDDGFYSHAKVLSIPRAVRAEAIGTWTICGTWSADKLTDGHIPAHMVEELGGTMAGAEALTAVRLWRRIRGEFVFQNWEEWQYTREQVETNREHERKRKAAAREKARESGAVSGSVPVGQAPDTAGTKPVSELPVPSSPVPTYLGEVNNVGPVLETGDEAPDGLDVRSKMFGFDGDRIRGELTRLTGEFPNDETVMTVSRTILGRAKTWPKDPTAFLVGSFRKYPEEVAKIAYGGAA